MNHLNSILLEGVVTGEPKVVLTSKSGQSLVKFTIANDRFYYDKEHNLKSTTLFIGIQSWGRLGEQALSLIHKGMTSRIVGRLRQVKYQKKDNSFVDTFEIVAQHIEYRKMKKKDEKVELDSDKLESELVTLESDIDECVEEAIVYYNYD